MKQSCQKAFALLIAVTLLLYSCEKGKNHSGSEEESKIKQLSESYAAAFNAHDSNKISHLLTEDAVYVNFNTDEVIEGKSTLIDYLKEQFADHDTSLKITIDSIVFKDADHAVEDGVAEISSKAQPPVQKIFNAEYVKINDSWLLQKISELNLSKQPSQVEHLKELSWLTGNWIDSDDNVSLNLSYEWAEGGNFLIQHFTMQILNHKQMEGVQIIGWDPSQEKMRSWIFDTDGGFGESLWFKQGMQWFARTSFTLPDGRKASAMHIYTKVDENTYTFASENRDVDGTLLPNIGPFKVIRNKGVKL